MTLVRKNYIDFGPTFAAEKLAEDHNVKASCEMLRKWMQDAEIWLSRKQRRTFHQLRRECLGELIQIDGSSWLRMKSQVVCWRDALRSSLKHRHRMLRNDQPAWLTNPAIYDVSALPSPATDTTKWDISTLHRDGHFRMGCIWQSSRKMMISYICKAIMSPSAATLAPLVTVLNDF